APVRRWHSKQWHMEMRTGSPSIVRWNWPQLQAARRAVKGRLRFTAAAHHATRARASEADRQSVSLDADFGPFLGVTGDELAELRRRAGEHDSAKIGETRLQGRVRQPGIHGGIEPDNDFRRRVLRCTKAGPETRLGTGYVISDGRTSGSIGARLALVTASAQP